MLYQHTRQTSWLIVSVSFTLPLSFTPALLPAFHLASDWPYCQHNFARPLIDGHNAYNMAALSSVPLSLSLCVSLLAAPLPLLSVSVA